MRLSPVPSCSFPAIGFATLVLLLCLLVYPSKTWAQSDITLIRADGARFPVRVYGDGGGCRPVMIVSHGFGGSQRGLYSLAEASAAAGYRVFVMAHLESGRAHLRAALRSKDRRRAIIAAAGSAESHRARFADLDAAWRHATHSCRPPFAVFAGHSMGAQTVMMEAGALARIGALGRNRFDAYIALSPQGVGARFARGAWRQVRKPVLMVTGTRDGGVDGSFQSRLSAFEGLPPGQKRLAIIDTANHRNIGGRGANPAARLPAILAMQFLQDIRSGRRSAVRAVPGVVFRDK